MKKRKKHDKIVLLAKTKLNTIGVSISKALIDLIISHDEFVSVNNMLKEYDDMKEKIKNSNNIIAQKMKFSIKDFFSKCDQIRSFLRIQSHLLKKSLMENFVFFPVHIKV